MACFGGVSQFKKKNKIPQGHVASTHDDSFGFVWGQYEICNTEYSES